MQQLFDTTKNIISLRVYVITGVINMPKIKECYSMSIAKTILEIFKGKFSLKEAYAANPDMPEASVRRSIYENLGISFQRVGRGMYMPMTTTGYVNEQIMLIEGDGRKLSAIQNNSLDAIITDHPWFDPKSNKGGNRAFASYDTFMYTEADFREKARVLKNGCFLVEFLPAENANNYEYLFQIKKMAEKAGFQYYSKVAWKKGTFVSNTGRKAKNTEDIMIFSKGNPRALRIDAKKTKNTGIISYMKGANGMLPTYFDVQPVPKKEVITQSEKPVELLKQIIEYITLPGEIILDQFAGSGVLGAAALLTDRLALLVEKAHEKVEAIAKRLNLVQITNTTLDGC